MKKLITILVMLFIGQSCTKEDITPPFIQILGDNPLTHKLKDSFQDPGFTAHDQEDGDITSKVIVNSTLNTNETGTYAIKYLVTDASGKSASATRTVHVKNELEINNQIGNFTVNDTINGTFNSSYNDITVASTTENGKMIFSNFGGYTGGSVSVYAIISGSSIDIPTQSGIFYPVTNIHRTFSGNGQIIATNPLTFILTYTEQTNNGTTIVKATYNQQ